MQSNKDWMPGKRVDQIAMARDWLQILSAKAPSWGVPASEVAVLRTLAENAEHLFEKIMSSEHSKITVAECQTALKNLAAKMRFVKNRYFLSPPLTEPDFAALQLKPKNTTPTPIPPPAEQAEADISRPGQHQLLLHLRAVANFTPSSYRSDYGFRIYFGVYPHGGATVEAATGTKRELVKIPVSGEELPHSRLTRRKRELFDFPQEDSGKTVYFAVRFENAKGELGPWGPIFAAVIP
ncbi:MAG: hypothetical protein LBU34_04395 [Planctomycetaceae bacterium]|nr:hypothetical protein [Planctomycetaceae bacterium]